MANGVAALDGVIVGPVAAADVAALDGAVVEMGARRVYAVEQLLNELARASTAEGGAEEEEEALRRSFGLPPSPRAFAQGGAVSGPQPAKTPQRRRSSTPAPTSTSAGRTARTPS